MPGSGASSRSTAVRAARPTYWMVLLAFMLGSLALRIWVLRTATAPGDLTLQVDEAQYWLWSRDLHWGYYSKPPVIAALIAGSTAWFGHDLLGVKLLAMAMYPVTALVLAELARRMALSVWPAVMSVEQSQAAGQWAERVGLLAAALFLTSPLTGLLGLAVTTDAPLLLFWACGAFLLWEALHRGRRRTWLLLGVVWGVGVLSKYTMLAFAASVLPLALTDGPGTRWLGWPGRPGGVTGSVLRDRLLGLMMTGGVMLLALLPHLAWNADHGWPTLTHTVEITAEAHRTDGRGGWSSVGEFTGGQWVQFGPLWLLVLLAAVVAVWRQRRSVAAVASGASVTVAAVGERWSRAMRFAFWLSAPLLIVGVAQAWNAKAQINWTAPAGHGLFLFGALWLGRLVGGGPLHAPESRHARVTGVWWVVVACVMWLHLVLVTAVPLAAPLAHIFGRPSEQPLPRHMDIWVRMRGWGPAYAQLAPVAQAHFRRWPQAQILGMDRQVISMGAYLWRDLEPAPAAGVPASFQRWVAWMPPGQRAPQDHFQLTTRWARPGTAAAAQPMLIISADDLPASLLENVEPPELVGDVTLPEGADRTLHLRVWSARARSGGTGGGS